MEENKSCDHIGKWQGLGTISLPLPDGKLMIIHNLYCTNCGHTESKNGFIQIKNSPIIKADGIIKKDKN